MLRIVFSMYFCCNYRSTDHLNMINYQNYLNNLEYLIMQCKIQYKKQVFVNFGKKSQKTLKYLSQLRLSKQNDTSQCQCKYPKDIIS